MNKENTLFYTRYLQKKLYFRNSELIGAMFDLEKFLFDNFQLNEEAPTSLFKQKWIYDCIKNGDYSNEISKKFEVFENKGLRNKILELLETFSEIPNFKETKIFFDLFKKFNQQFNNLLSRDKKSNFKTHLYFQMALLAYIRNAEIKIFSESKIHLNNKLIDIFEVVFIESFLKNKNKISKTLYLFKLIIKLIGKK